MCWSEMINTFCIKKEGLEIMIKEEQRMLRDIGFFFK